MNNDELIHAIFQSTQPVMSGTIREVIPASNAIPNRSDSGLRRSLSGDITFTTRNVEWANQSVNFHAQLLRYIPETKITSPILSDTIQIPHNIGRWYSFTSDFLGRDCEEANFGPLFEYDFVAPNIVVGKSVAFPSDFAAWSTYSSGCTSTMHATVPKRAQVVFYQLDPATTTPLKKQVLDLTRLYHQYAVNHADQPEILKTLHLASDEIPAIRNILEGKYPQKDSRWPGLSMDEHSAMRYDPTSQTVLLKHTSRGCFHYQNFYQTLEIKDGKINHNFTSYQQGEPSPLEEKMKEQHENPKDTLIVGSGDNLALQRRNQPVETQQPLASLYHDYNYNTQVASWRITPKSHWQGNLTPIPLKIPSFANKYGPKQSILHQASPTQYLFEMLGRVYCLDTEK